MQHCVWKTVFKNIHSLLTVMSKRKLPKWLTCDFSGQILHHEKWLRRIRTRHFEGTFLLQQIHSDSGCCFDWRSLNEIIILTNIFLSKFCLDWWKVWVYFYVILCSVFFHTVMFVSIRKITTNVLFSFSYKPNKKIWKILMWYFLLYFNS